MDNKLNVDANNISLMYFNLFTFTSLCFAYSTPLTPSSHPPQGPLLAASNVRNMFRLK